MTTKRYFKGVWQVRNNGYTIEQFQREDDADAFIERAGAFPSLHANLNVSNVGRTAHLITRL